MPQVDSWHYISFTQSMQNAQPTSSLFSQREWCSRIPQEYRIDSVFIDLSPQSIQFLLSDDTNPNLSHFHQQSSIQAGIKALGGAVFVKLAQRTPKDCSKLDRKLSTLSQLVMIVKMSQYLTEAVAEEQSGCQLILRKHWSRLEEGTDQFRVYVLEGQLVGLCQKDPSYLGTHPTINQITAIKNMQKQIQSALTGLQGQSYVMDLYCSPNGKGMRLFAIEPFHVHALGLIDEERLRQQVGKAGLIVQIVEREQQLKELDFSQYRAGAQLKQLKNVNEWVDFMKNRAEQ